MISQVSSLEIVEDVQVDMPAHQMGFFKYARLSDATAPYVVFAAAAFNPYRPILVLVPMSKIIITFFVIIELIPKAMELEPARASPIHLSSTVIVLVVCA